MPVLNPKALIENRVEAIRDLHESIGNMKAELDLSGGVDSAVMCGLLAKALGPENVLCVYSSIHSDPASLERAREVAETFGVALVELDLGDLFDQLWDQMVDGYADALAERNITVAERKNNTRLAWHRDVQRNLKRRMKSDGTIQGGFRSCIRAPIGRAYNRISGGGIRHGTGNECEDRWLRFYQKGGDGEVDCNPLAMLSKGECYQLAVALGVPRSIIDAKPSPDLWGEGEEAHNDEDELLTWAGAPFTYSRVNPETGEYTRVGTIEMVSRLLDEEVLHPQPDGGETVSSFEHWMFGDTEPNWDHIEDYVESNMQPGIALADMMTLLKSARRVERMTRHKMNPNCPALGSREELLRAEIITNTLPDLGA